MSASGQHAAASERQAAATMAGVSRRFGDVHAVRDLSLTVPRGAVFGLIGPNGAGKTTTIRILMGILTADSGRINVLGESDPSRIKARLGYLPEEKGLYRKMRLGEFVTWFARLKGMERRQASAEAARMLAAFGLAERHRDRCESLSKGMGQKVQVLTTLIHRPELVVLDEPFSGLDPINVELVRDAILDLKAEGRTVILSTHIMEQAEQICDEIALVNRGRVVLGGNLSELMSGGDTLTVEYEDGQPAFTELPGVLRANDTGNRAELRLAADADPQRLLAALLERVRIIRFDTTETSLHELFVHAVEGDVEPPDQTAADQPETRQARP